MKPQVGTSWEKKMEQRASRKQFLEFKKEAVDAAKDKRKVSSSQFLFAAVNARRFLHTIFRVKAG
jgi:hypothetical protein